MMKPWKLLKEDQEYKNKYVDIRKRTYTLPNNKEADYFIRDGMGNVASIFAITNNNEIILAREFRPGPGKVLDELPGGVIDPNETPLQAAKRELFEETGYKGELTLLSKTWMSAYSTGKKYCYIAQNCKKHSEKQNMDHENEFIEVILKSKTAFEKQLKNGELTDMETALLAMQYLKAK
jgi:ADP-ribose pyrophosphatase